MADLSVLRAQIWQIGEEMVRCKRDCEGIARDLTQGTLPRCLWLESEARDDGQACAIVGINPGSGTPGDAERSYYVEKGASYASVVRWWHVQQPGKRYYPPLRKLADELGLTGPILWTERVKCENAPDTQPTLDTFRTCARKYLTWELSLLPDDWPLIAVGQGTYHALAYLALDRIVIGVPHPSGSYGHFSALFANGGLRPQIGEAVAALLTERRPRAVWLPDVN
jgi:hypothetical protein